MPVAASDLSTLSRLLDAVTALAPSEREAWFAALPAEQRHLEAPLRQMLVDEEALERDTDSFKLPRIESAAAGCRERG